MPCALASRICVCRYCTCVCREPSPTLSPTDPVPRDLLTLCPAASSGPQGLYTAYIQPICSPNLYVCMDGWIYTVYIYASWAYKGFVPSSRQWHTHAQTHTHTYTCTHTRLLLAIEAATAILIHILRAHAHMPGRCRYLQLLLCAQVPEAIRLAKRHFPPFFAAHAAQVVCLFLYPPTLPPTHPLTHPPTHARMHACMHARSLTKKEA